MKSFKIKHALVAFAFFTIPSVGVSKTLQEALIEAYQTNPTLLSERASLRSQDETVAQARAAGRPTMTGVMVGERAQTTLFPNGVADTQDSIDSFRASLNIELLLFDGGKTSNAISAAENMVFAGQSNLNASEQNILLQAATAYLDVRRDLRFVALGESNVKLIAQQVEASKDRFQVGAITRTEVALAEARLAAAKTNLAASLGRLALSKEIYRAIIGSNPVNLQAPPRLPQLPSSLGEAESIAMREHPSILAARYAEKAATHDLERARAAWSPNISLGASVSYSNSDGKTQGTIFTPPQPIPGAMQNSVTISGQIPIYQGGAMSSGLRAAVEIFEARKASTQSVMRTIRQATATAWANLRVARASINAARLEIEANQIAYDGINEELRLGVRTTLELLDAEQRLLTARSNLASAQRDEYVATFNLLSAMGLLTVDNLALGIPAYDPNINFDRVKNAPDIIFEGGTVLDAISDRWE